jgi:hypothetical protein
LTCGQVPATVRLVVAGDGHGEGDGEIVPLGIGIDEALSMIADAIKQEHCILFLGAGVHAPPPDGATFQYPVPLRPPLGSQLSEQLAEACKLAERLPAEHPENLLRVALLYERVFGRRKLVELVTEKVQKGKSASPILRALAEMGFPVIISTNYDQLFEDALDKAGRHPRRVIYTPDDRGRTVDYPDPTAEQPIVFKIHGDISEPDSMVITDEDYIQFVLRMSTSKRAYDPVPLTVKTRLTEWTTLFVGYSLLDFNLRLLLKTLRWKIDHSCKPDMFSIDFSPDPLVLDVWQDERREVTFIATDVWAFVPRLYEEVVGKALLA